MEKINYNLYDFEFDKKNSNVVIIKKKGENKIHQMFVCPPIENGCDIINFSGSKIDCHYEYDFDGLILLTTKDNRKLYHKGNLIAEIKRFKKM